MLEVEESEYDKDGNRRDKPSTIKKRKKTKKRSPSYQNTSMGDVQRLLDAEVQSVAPSDTSAPDILSHDVTDWRRGSS
jgi:hypothetical protein